MLKDAYRFLHLEERESFAGSNDYVWVLVVKMNSFYWTDNVSDMSKPNPMLSKVVK